MSARYALAVASAVICYAAIFLCRTLGVHIDENNYLAFAATGNYQDTLNQGKPVLFYWLNELLFKIHPLAIHFVYLAANVAALGWFARGSLVLFGLLAAAPFLVLNSTQLMMETPLTAAITVAFACVLRLAEAPRRREGFAGAAAFFAAVWLKATSVPALALLLFAFRRGLGRGELITLGGAAIAGYCVDKLVLLLLGARSEDFGGAHQLLSPAVLAERIVELPGYGLTWAFYVGIPLLAFLAWRYRKRPWAPEVVVLALSLPLTLALGLASRWNLVRYAYPCIQVGLLAGLVLLCRARPRASIVGAVAAAQLALVLNMWAFASPGGRRLSAWPALVREELHESGYTVLTGVPVYWWAATSSGTRNPCVLIHVAGSEKPYAVRQILSLLTEGAVFVDENGKDAFEKCTGPKILARRQYYDGGERCRLACDGAEFGVTSCDTQMIMVYPTVRRPLVNETCLP